MKKILFLFLLVAFIGCKPEIKPTENKSYEFSSIKDLLIYNIIGNLDKSIKIFPDGMYYNDVVIYDRSKFINMNWQEIKNTFLINDSANITKDLTVVFISYSVKSDVIREVEWVRKINDKYFTSSIYLSLYGDYRDRKDFENINEGTITSLIARIKKWEDSSSNTWWHPVL